MYINHITACSTAFYRFLSFPPRAFRPVLFAAGKAAVAAIGGIVL